MKLITFRQYIKGTSYRVYCEDEKIYIGEIYSSKIEANNVALEHILANDHIVTVRTIKLKSNGKI